jgi:alpha-glucosidase
MDNYKDFTYDPVNFNGLNDFVDELHSKNMHYIPILDAGIAQRSGFDIYNDGVDKGIYLKTDKGEVFTGKVWPDDAAYPDMNHPDGPAWWKSQLDRMHD